MTTDDLPPWATGPAEILKHGLDLLRKDSDANRRLAMISIDNSVELTIKTYLGLPRRVNALEISRAEYQDFAESFPKLLDALAKHAKSKIGTSDLGEIEWYHRLRNELYHQGNGLTVERAKVESYGQLAAALFESLFGVKPPTPTDAAYYLLAEFIIAWADFERAADDLSTFYWFDENTNLRTTLEYAAELSLNGYLSEPEYREIEYLWAIRNDVVYGNLYFREIITSEMVAKLAQITRSVQSRITGK